MDVASPATLNIKIPVPSTYFRLNSGNLIIKFPTKAYNIKTLNCLLNDVPKDCSSTFY